MAKGSSGAGAPSGNKVSSRAATSAHTQKAASQVHSSHNMPPVANNRGIVPVHTGSNPGGRWAAHHGYLGRAR